MTTTLRASDRQVELRRPSLRATEARVPVADERAALRLLREVGAAGHSAALRRALEEARPGYDVRGLGDAELVREVATCLAHGRLHAYAVELRTPIRAVEKIEPEPPKAPVDKALTWIEILLKDTEGHPVPGERYLVKLADGTELEGTLDERGRALVDLIPAGMCKVAFPDLDGADWRPA